MKKNCIIAGLAVFALTASLFAGCGANDSATSTSANSSPAAEAAATEAPKATETPAATEAPTAAAKETPAVTEEPKATETPAASKEPAAPAEVSKDGVSEITVDEAKKIAFDDAGVSESDVVLKKAEIGMDDGIQKYEVDFYCQDTEYSYDIDPVTGAITEVDKDAMDAEDYAEMEALQSEAGNGGFAIDEDTAFDMAITYAAVSVEDVYDSYVHLDFDDDYGMEVYDIEFKANGTEYSFDIDPNTGEILKYEADTDD